MLAPTVMIESSAHLGPKQKRFNQLVASIAKLKATVQVWAGLRNEIVRASPELVLLEGELREVMREIVMTCDRHHAALTRSERAQLSELICGIVLEHLAQGAGPDPAIKEIYNRHGRTDFDAERATDEAAQLEEMREALEHHGISVDESIDSVEELAAAARAELHARETAAAEARAARAARRPTSKRQRAAQLERENAQTEASRALQDVYRKLAMALHPDRESDDAARAQKTILMAEVNTAYERRDLLALLELQLRVEQIDRGSIGSLAEERLDRFNKLLAEQVGQLKAEIAELELPYRMQLEVPTRRKLTPAQVMACFHDDVRAVANDLAAARRDLEMMRDVAALRRMLRDTRQTRTRETEEMLKALGAVLHDTHAEMRTRRPVPTRSPNSRRRR